MEKYLREQMKNAFISKANGKKCHVGLMGGSICKISAEVHQHISGGLELDELKLLSNPNHSIKAENTHC